MAAARESDGGRRIEACEGGGHSVRSISLGLSPRGIGGLDHLDAESAFGLVPADLGCRSSPARNGPTPARSCGSPTSTATGSPASRPAPKAASSRTWSYGTAAASAARTASGTWNAKDTGLRNLALKGYAQNQIWCEIVALASELLAWMAMLALPGTACRRERKRLRLRLFSAAGRIVRGGRRLRLRISAAWPRAPDITAAFSRLQALTPG